MRLRYQAQYEPRPAQQTILCGVMGRVPLAAARYATLADGVYSCTMQMRLMLCGN